MTEILAAGDWRTNAELIADVARLGWLDGHVLDLTYDKGNFWTAYQPEQLTTNDLYKRTADHHHDAAGPVPFEWRHHFDAVVFDPPYKLNGTPDPDEGYGANRKATKAERYELITIGSSNAARMVRPGGWLHVKVQNQIVGGRYSNMACAVTEILAIEGSLELRAIWHLVTHPRPQPAGRRQLNPRNNVSQLLSFHRKDTRS